MARILMTAANGGFGALAARAVLKAGHQLVATIRDQQTRNAEPAAALRALGATVIDVDVTDDESVERGAEAALSSLGGLDVLVNVAGSGTHGLSEGFTSAQMLRLFDLNVVGAHRMMRAVLPTLRAQQAGLIINISSLLGRLSMPFYGPYSATKFALESLSDTYRVELAQFGVDIVLVEPGGFKTGFIEALVRPEDAERLRDYGDFAAVPQQALTRYESLLATKREQDPTKVSEAILALIDLPAGSRPQRSVVDYLGMGEHVETMNDLLAQTTAGIYHAFGSDGLLHLKTTR